MVTLLVNHAGSWPDIEGITEAVELVEPVEPLSARSQAVTRRTWSGTWHGWNKRRPKSGAQRKSEGKQPCYLVVDIEMMKRFDGSTWENPWTSILNKAFQWENHPKPWGFLLHRHVRLPAYLTPNVYFFWLVETSKPWQLKSGHL